LTYRFGSVRVSGSMSTFKKEGFFVLSLKDGTALSARSLEALPEGILALINGISTMISADDLVKSWHVAGDLPLAELEHFSKIGAALASFEGALTAYRNETGSEPFAVARSPLVFGATSLAFTLAPFRASEDIDLAVSQDFIDWSELHWNPPLEVGVDLCCEDLLDLCGRWRERTVGVAGLTGVRFRLLHPLDVVSQKLLRRSEDTFFERDVFDIESVMGRLNPPKETIVSLLTESAHRYNPTPHDPDGA
jgi:hypothetical protein